VTDNPEIESVTRIINAGPEQIFRVLTDPAMHRRKGPDFARRALQLTADDPGTLANTILALSFFGEDIKMVRWTPCFEDTTA